MGGNQAPTTGADSGAGGAGEQGAFTFNPTASGDSAINNWANADFNSFTVVAPTQNATQSLFGGGAGQAQAGTGIDFFKAAAGNNDTFTAGNVTFNDIQTAAASGSVSATAAQAAFVTGREFVSQVTGNTDTSATVTATTKTTATDENGNTLTLGDLSKRLSSTTTSTTYSSTAQASTAVTFPTKTAAENSAKTFNIGKAADAKDRFNVLIITDGVDVSGQPIIKYVVVKGTQAYYVGTTTPIPGVYKAPNGSLVAYNDQGKQNLAKATQESSGAIAAENASNAEKEAKEGKEETKKASKKVDDREKLKEIRDDNKSILNKYTSTNASSYSSTKALAEIATIVINDVSYVPMSPLTAEGQGAPKVFYKKQGEQSDKTKQAFTIVLDASGEISTKINGQDTKDDVSLTNGSLGVSLIDASYWGFIAKSRGDNTSTANLKSKLDADTPIYSRNVVFTTGNYEENKNNTVNLTNKLEVAASSAKVISELDRLFNKPTTPPTFATLTNDQSGKSSWKMNFM